MSKGKYSPALTKKIIADNAGQYIYNADKQIPPETWAEGEYNTRLHYGIYDKDGFDSYGYSAFEDGKYIDIGAGIDRWGYTENDYLCMSNDEFNDICMYGG